MGIFVYSQRWINSTSDTNSPFIPKTLNNGVVNLHNKNTSNYQAYHKTRRSILVIRNRHTKLLSEIFLRLGSMSKIVPYAVLSRSWRNEDLQSVDKNLSQSQI